MIDVKKANVIREILCDIYGEISHMDTPGKDPGLFNGLAGQLLFKWNLSKYSVSLVDEQLFSQEIEQVQEAFQRSSDITLCNGLSGYGWLLEFLQGDQDTNPYEPDLSLEVENFLLKSLDIESWGGEFEIIQGLAGFSVYSRRRFVQSKSKLLYGNIIQHILARSTLTDKGLTWVTGTESVFRKHPENLHEYDLGLAHGVTSAIAALTYALPLLQDKRLNLEEALTDSCDWLLMHRLEDDKHDSCFGYIAGEPMNARLGWCYGDASNALILAKAGHQIRSNYIFEQARSIAINATKRNRQNSGVVDAGICHGAAGLYLVFYRLWQILGDLELLNCAYFWLDELIGMYRSKGLAGLSTFDSNIGTERLEYGLLEGISGVGLVLLHALGVDNSWDECLMLS